MTGSSKGPERPLQVLGVTCCWWLVHVWVHAHTSCSAVQHTWGQLLREWLMVVPVSVNAHTHAPSHLCVHLLLKMESHFCLPR